MAAAYFIQTVVVLFALFLTFFKQGKTITERLYCNAVYWAIIIELLFVVVIWVANFIKDLI
jgi:hypothetical protein